MLLSTFIVLAFLGSILLTIVRHGLPAMNWDMLTKLPGGGFYIGKEGGVLNAIVGSLYIVGASTIIGLLVSIPIVFYINVYLKNVQLQATLPVCHLMCFMAYHQSFTELSLSLL
jgi:ABC-type phosphate transport system, permease component